MSKYIIIFFILGCFLFLYSLSFEAYIDTEIFYQEYHQLSAGQSKEFYELRDSMLTSKYYIQDIGITLMLTSSILLLLLKKGNTNIKSPKNKSSFIKIAFLLPLITVWGFIFDLGQGMYRTEFPYWADSLAIPLAGVPIQFIILLIWSTLHLFFLRNVEVSSVIFKVSNLNKVNSWLKIIITLSFGLVFLSFIYGHYCYTIPGLFWIYYYFSLGLIRIKE